MRVADIPSSKSDAILADREALISFDEKKWARADSNDYFDIKITHSAHVTDLVGLYLLA